MPSSSLQTSVIHTTTCRMQNEVAKGWVAGPFSTSPLLTLLISHFHVVTAYRIVPLHRHHHYLLGMQWRGKYFNDLGLPFGLPSAQYILYSVANLAEWVLKENYGMMCRFPLLVSVSLSDVLAQFSYFHSLRNRVFLYTQRDWRVLQHVWQCCGQRLLLFSIRHASPK